MTKGLFTLSFLLVLLGLGSYVGSGGASATSLIPAFLGGAMAILVFFERRSAYPRRWIIGMTTLALLGFAGSVRGLMQIPSLIAGAEVGRPVAVGAQAGMAVLCLSFLVPIIARLSTATIPVVNRPRNR